MRGFLPLLLLASLLYAATYLFIKVAVEGLAPTTIVATRMLCAAPVFLVAASRSRGARAAVAAVRRATRQGLVLGVVQFAVPITLIAWGEKWVSSGTAAVAIASTPLFVELLARRLRPSERVRGLRLLGVVLGFVGVAVLTGVAPSGEGRELLGTLAVVGAAFCFALGQLYAQSALERIDTLTIAASSSVCGGLVLLPAGLAQLPDGHPGWGPLAALGALILVNSIASQLLGFHILRRYGAARNSLSTYLTPPLAVILGVILLGESVTLAALAGLVLILTGVALGSGVGRVPIRRARPPLAPS